MSGETVDYVLADGEELHRRNPRSFFSPSRSLRDSLHVGDLAKLLFTIIDPPEAGPSGERMWVEITERTPTGYVGVLINRPAAITTVHQGEPVHFGPENVISVPERWQLMEKKIFVSRRSHERDVRPRYVYREDPDRERDSGWRALIGDESDEELDNPHNILLQPVGFLLDRWPELRPVFHTDPQNGAWSWDEPSRRYIRDPS